MQRARFTKASARVRAWERVLTVTGRPHPFEDAESISEVGERISMIRLLRPFLVLQKPRAVRSTAEM